MKKIIVNFKEVKVPEWFEGTDANVMTVEGIGFPIRLPWDEKPVERFDRYCESPPNPEQKQLLDYISDCEEKMDAVNIMTAKGLSQSQALAIRVELSNRLLNGEVVNPWEDYKRTSHQASWKSDGRPRYSKEIQPTNLQELRAEAMWEVAEIIKAFHSLS